MNCKNDCKVCDRIVFSNSITVSGSNLVVNIPAGTYINRCRFCLVLVQTIPTTATINMPVVVTIGTDTTQYPMVKCDCASVTACALRTRTRYPMMVVTTATSGSFRVLRNLACAPVNVLTSLPAPTVTQSETETVTQSDIDALANSKSVTKTVTTRTSLKTE